MDNTYSSKQNGGQSNLSTLLLLLLLAGFQPVLSTDTEDAEPDDDDNGGLKVMIVGPDYVTVGVPSSVECVADCSTCTYSMSLDGHSAQGKGNVLAFTLKNWVEALTVSCTVTDEDPEQTTTVTKQLQVLAGPANVSITGPDLINPTGSYTYSCHGYCRPSCIYAWKSDRGPWIKGQGNVISITPQEMDSIKTVLCKATNSVSGLFVTTTRKINVTSGPSEVQIKGPDEIEMAETSKFVCTAKCVPSCRYVMSVENQTMRGNVVEITMEDSFKSITLKCEAQNTVSRMTVTALKTVLRKGSDHNLSTRPEETSAVLLLAFIISSVFIL